MKTKLKLIRGSLLAAVLLALPAVVQAQFTFTTNNGAISITRYTGTNLNVVIPSTTNGYPVTSIGTPAFQLLQTITSVTIPSSVTNIGGGAFYYCTGLTNITVDAANAVYSSLNGVLFNKAQTTLILFPPGRGGSYIIPAGVTNSASFGFCIHLTSVIIPNSMTIIGDSMFSNCTSLTNVTIPNGIAIIGYSAFEECDSLTSVAIPNSVISIETFAFRYCNSLTSVTIGNSVTNIGIGAFDSCISLMKIAIPSSVTSIGDGVFSACFSLTNITVSISNPAYSSLSGVLFDKAQATLIRFPPSKTGSYSIPNSVISFSGDAFAECYYLTSVTIGNGVTNIGGGAFSDCYNLTSVSFGNSITGIGDLAFANTGLTKVTIPNSVTSIGWQAFSYCDDLMSVTIPNSVTNIGYEAFTPCPSLVSAYFMGNAPPDNSYAFYGDPATVYYLSGTTGWGSTFGYVPTVLWNPRPNTIGYIGGHFGFNLTGPTNTTIVVEACTDLSHPVWLPVATNTFSASGTSTFSDSTSGSYPSRYYRVRSP